MTAAIGQSRRLAITTEEHDDILPKQREGDGPVAESLHRHRGVPETAENLLLGAQHDAPLDGQINV
jgi:hypothetical protein